MDSIDPATATPFSVESNKLVRLPFQGGFIEAVRDKHGQGWLAIKPACEAMGIDFSAQRKKLEQQPWATVAMIATVGADQRHRKMFTLDRACVPMWLATLEAVRIKNPAARAAVELWQQEATAVLNRAFDTEVVRLPELLEQRMLAIYRTEIHTVLESYAKLLVERHLAAMDQAFEVCAQRHIEEATNEPSAELLCEATTSVLWQAHQATGYPIGELDIYNAVSEIVWRFTAKRRRFNPETGYPLSMAKSRPDLYERVRLAFQRCGVRGPARPL